jgi:GTP-binding protein
LHLVDVAPLDESDPVQAVKTIVNELQQYDLDLLNKERWLVFNKIDLLPAEVAEQRCNEIIKKLNWQGPIFQISALRHQGTQELCQQLMQRLIALAV